MLLLIVAAGISVVILDKNEAEEDKAGMQPLYVVHPENAPPPISVDATKPLATSRPSGPSRPKTPPHRQSPANAFARSEKFPPGSVVELNTADTATLKKVPGIGSVFASRIVQYRTILGGFYSVAQLREVYGIDEERYLSLQSWFHADTAFIAKLPVNRLPSDTLARHPYLSYKQARIIQQLCRQKGRLDGWENLRLLEEFTEADRERLSPYLSFQ